MSEEEFESEALLADGFEEALIGIGIQFNNEVAVYDYEKCVKVLMERDKMKLGEAIEYMDYNVLGAYVGENTPVFIAF